MQKTGRLTIANKGNRVGEMMLYGSIGYDYLYGDGVSAATFAKELKALGNISTLNLRINSEGGVVTEARAMYNLLVQHPAKINVEIDGFAASAASFLAMAGDHITIAEGALFMIHNARAGRPGGNGEAKDFRAMADVLDVVNDTIRETYVARTGIDAARMKRWMDAETWMSGKEALANGFVDAVSENRGQVAACTDVYKKVPWFVNEPKSLRPNRAAVIKLRERLALS